jgi:hypothetical protein
MQDLQARPPWYARTLPSALLAANSMGAPGCIVFHCPRLHCPRLASLVQHSTGFFVKANAHLQADHAPQLLLPARENACRLGEGGARRGNSLPQWVFVVSALLEPRLSVHRQQLSPAK